MTGCGACRGANIQSYKVMKRTFKYSLDRRSRRITAATCIVVAGVLVWSLFYGMGDYLPAWLIATAIAVAALYVLSIPRSIKVEKDALDIHCIVELTHIPVGDLKSIRKIGPEDMRSAFPLLGSYGFFGYYGYYFRLRQWEMIKVYASRWSDFVEIEDIYEQKFVVSCPQADKLIETVDAMRQAYKPAAQDDMRP